MTKPFTKIDQLEKYLLGKLYEYYDWQMEMEDVNDVSSDADYLEGLREATEMMLIKIGCKYPTYEEYVDKVETAVWRPA